MARNKMARPLTRDERDAAATLHAEVTGPLPIRDYVTRESVETGGTVRLDPVNGGRDPESVLIAALVEQGAIKVVPAPTVPAEQDDPPANLPTPKADKAATSKG